MIGAITGDIVGSIYEFDNIKSKQFTLFGSDVEYTDDSVLTLATAQWLLKGGTPAQYYLEFAQHYPVPMGDYGSGFKKWLSRSKKAGSPAPAYNSCGNGSAMRISPVGWAFDDEAQVLEAARTSAECTHSHPEGVKGAQAVALAILLARKGMAAADIRSRIAREFGYDLSASVEEIRPDYDWGGLCQDTVPQALTAAFEARDFEDAIRNAISLGGDSDTLACITGGVAEALFGIPRTIQQQAMNYLPDYLKQVVTEFESRFGSRIIENSAVGRRSNISHNIVSGDKVGGAPLNAEYTPEHITRLGESDIFVFGSNLRGMHGGGAARVAYNSFGAVWGQGDGLQGNSYAIPTMQGGVNTIRPYVDRFIAFARTRPDLTFYVTKIGCGIAGFHVRDIAPLFAGAVGVPNIRLPRDFNPYLN